MIINYIKAKRAEWKIKATIYNAIFELVDNSKDIVDVVIKSVNVLKNTSDEDFKKQLISEVAKLVSKPQGEDE